MLRVLTVVPRYLPGYKAGGPIRTIANVIDWLGDQIQFLVLTADRDLGDTQPYSSVRVGEWQPVGKAQVCYLAPAALRLWTWPARLRKLQYDVLYLNGFFAATTRHLLWLRRVGRIPRGPVIVAPRGEFSRGALALKRHKKLAYLSVVRQLRLCDGAIWQASSEYEREDIRRAVDARSIRIAPNLATLSMQAAISRRPIKQAGRMQVVFFSRVSRQKNLDYALKLLKDVRGDVEFDICGPLEDTAYWRECEAITALLPPNVRVTYKGAVAPERVSEMFARYHLLLLPTRGENFGHTILEALRAACPVVISDRTPWRDLSAVRAGWDVSLSEPEQFEAILQRLIDMDEKEYATWSQGARSEGERFAADPAVLEANRELFLDVGSASSWLREQDGRGARSRN